MSDHSYTGDDEHKVAMQGGGEDGGDYDSGYSHGRGHGHDHSHGDSRHRRHHGHERHSTNCFCTSWSIKDDAGFKALALKAWCPHYTLASGSY